MSQQYLNPAISEVCFLTGDIGGACRRLAELYEIRDWREASYTARGKGSMRLFRHEPEQGLCFSVYEESADAVFPFRQTRGQALHHVCHPAADYGKACAIALQSGLSMLSEGVVASEDGTGRSAFFYDRVLGSVIQLLEEDGAGRKQPPAADTILGAVGLGHVGYLTGDRESVLAHLGELYGLGDWLRVEYKPQKAWCYGRPVEGQYHVKAAVIPGAAGCSWEINQAVSEGTHRDYLHRWPNRINHLCHKIQEFEYWRSYFVGHGCIEVFSAEMEDDVMGYRRCFYAYDGALDAIFELMEKPHFRHGTGGCAE